MWTIKAVMMPHILKKKICFLSFNPQAINYFSSTTISYNALYKTQTNATETKEGWIMVL